MLTQPRFCQNHVMQIAPSNSARILIFDSGVGALSVFKEISKLNPKLHCTLALDNALFPYGLQPEETLITRVLGCMETLIQECRPNIVVIACNTASTLVLSHLRERFNLPFVGVVPAIKPAAEVSNTKVIGLLATPATVARDYTQQLIDDFALDCEILKIGSAELVTMAEQKLRGEDIDLDRLQTILKPFIDRTQAKHTQLLDTVVLACTHFPLLEDDIATLMPSHIKIMDSGSAIAQRVNSLLSDNPIKDENDELHEVILSAQDDRISQLNSVFSLYNCAPIRVTPF